MAETNDVLFFVDAQGSSELLEQCQVRSLNSELIFKISHIFTLQFQYFKEQEFANSRNDKILRSQITALLEKREEAGSENEVILSTIVRKSCFICVYKRLKVRK